MNMLQIIYLILVFLIVSGVVLIVIFELSHGGVLGRLQQLQKQSPPAEQDSGLQQSDPVWVQRIVEWASPLARLSLPEEGWENSQLRIRFMNAGYRNSKAPILFFALKTILTFFLPIVVLLSARLADWQMPPALFHVLVLASAAGGYFLPNLVLWRQTVLRKREIFEHFPDAIDLMTVCVEAGLGLDAALARVGEEMSLSSKAMGEEMHLVNLELRAGSSRERALRNLALRTGVEEVDTLVAMLVQSDRFGTSVADALRVHSDSLRTKRRLRAEEAAAKIPLKLLFPLIFCVFPSMLLVLLGPAFISIYRILLPTFSSMQ